MSHPRHSAIKPPKGDTSLVLQWLRRHAFTAGGVGSVPGPELRSHTAGLRGKKTKLLATRCYLAAPYFMLCKRPGSGEPENAVGAWCWKPPTLQELGIREAKHAVGAWPSSTTEPGRRPPFPLCSPHQPQRMKLIIMPTGKEKTFF